MAGSSLRSVSTGYLGRFCRNLYSIGSRIVAVKESSLAVSLQHADRLSILYSLESCDAAGSGVLGRRIAPCEVQLSE